MELNNLYLKFLAELQSGLKILTDKSEETAENTLKALWFAAAGEKISAVRVKDKVLPELNDSQIKTLTEYIQVRLSGVPLTHITERQDFMGLEFMIEKGLYIPRKETELLANTAIQLIKDKFANIDLVKLIDLCTGSGSIALSVAHYCKNTFAYGCDIYEPNIVSATKNAEQFSLKERSKIEYGDLFSPYLNETFFNNVDMITCAPPYISSSKVGKMDTEISKHEPKEAFDAGTFGLDIVLKLISESPKLLKPGGILVFECGLGQGDFLINKMIASKYYREVNKHCDLAGNVRVLSGII